MALSASLSTQQRCKKLPAVPHPTQDVHPEPGIQFPLSASPTSTRATPVLPNQSLPTCPLVDTGAGLAGSSQRADLQGVLAAGQQPVEQEGGGVWQDRHISHERLGVAVVEGKVVAVPLPAGVLPGGVQRGPAPTAAQAQVADG